MSGRLADEVFDREMPDDMPSPKARDVLLVYSLKANADGTESRPGNALVAAKVGCGERTLSSLKQYWISKGVLRLVRRGRKVAGRGNALPNVYEVHLEVLPVKAQVKPRVERPATAVPGDAGRSDDERERPAIRDERPAIWRERLATVVPSVSEERPLERPLERPYKRPSDFEDEREEPNPNGQPPQRRKDQDPDVREMAKQIGTYSRFDPPTPETEPTAAASAASSSTLVGRTATPTAWPRSCRSLRERQKFD